MERTIGNLGQEIHLHSNPYANLTQCGIARCVANSIYARYPALWSRLPDLPQGAILLSGGYALLHPWEESPSRMCDDEFAVLQRYANHNPGVIISEQIMRYGRIQLPNGHQVQCAWREDERRQEPRVSRMVKVCLVRSL